MSAPDQIFNLSVKVGEEFDISLTSTPGSGAIWYFTPASGGPELVRQETTPQGSGVGGPATQTFVFRCDQAGAYQLSFDLKRAWEPTVRSHATANVQVS